MTKVLAIIGNMLAFAIYGIGLVSPLTPSEGLPGIGSLLTFVGLPLLLLMYAACVYSSRAAKTAVRLQALMVTSFTAWLIYLQLN